MEWWACMLLFFGGLIILLLTELPVVFAFMLVNVVGVYLLWGGTIGLEQLILSIDSSVSTFVLVPADVHSHGHGDVPSRCCLQDDRCARSMARGHRGPAVFARGSCRCAVCNAHRSRDG